MSRLVQSSVTRPADTTAYAAGDVVGGLLTFGAGQAHGIVETAVLVGTAAEATKPELDLFFFSEPPTVAADNAAFVPTDDQMINTCLGVITFLAADFHVGSANGVAHNVLHQNPSVSFLAPSGLFYGVLVARNAYVPISAEVFAVKLGLHLSV
jgi:hypothetical protein